MRVWRRHWSEQLVLKPFWVNMLILWTTIPLFCEIVGRAFGVSFLGLVVGGEICLIKTTYDYIKEKYF
ncbi:MAG: hypothetical protein J7L31_06970 [Thermoplasmata archaeon]|nr:hypothetical protein [Thermoplasmata archaeon]